MDANKIKIGLAGFGLDTYWAQFTGLKERLAGYRDFSHSRLHSLDRVWYPHCAIGTGHVAGALAKVAHILDIKFVKVC